MVKEKLTGDEMKNEFSPVVVFVYNRPEHTRRMLEALQNNTLASETHLIIYADGTSSENAELLKSIQETREVAESIGGFKTKEIIESSKNKGLAASIIQGVSEVVKRYGKVIVLEDDIVVGKFFLEYMNDALVKYEKDRNVWHVTGWHEPIKRADMQKCSFYPLMDCWSWGTWADRWECFNKNPAEMLGRYSEEDIYHFNVDGLVPNKWNQVIGNYLGRNNTWAIFWYAVILENEGLCLGPCYSLVQNIGFDNSGVHSKKRDAVKITGDINRKISDFPEKIELDTEFYNELKAIYKVRYRRERTRERFKKILPGWIYSFISAKLHGE